MDRFPGWATVYLGRAGPDKAIAGTVAPTEFPLTGLSLPLVTARRTADTTVQASMPGM